MEEIVIRVGGEGGQRPANYSKDMGKLVFFGRREMTGSRRGTASLLVNLMRMGQRNIEI